MKWTEVSKQTPEHFVPVLVEAGYGSVCIATWDDCSGKFVQDTTQAELYGSKPLGDLREQPKRWAYLQEREQ